MAALVGSLTVGRNRTKMVAKASPTDRLKSLHDKLNATAVGIYGKRAADAGK